MEIIKILASIIYITYNSFNVSRGNLVQSIKTLHLMFYSLTVNLALYHFIFGSEANLRSHFQPQTLDEFSNTKNDSVELILCKDSDNSLVLTKPSD